MCAVLETPVLRFEASAVRCLKVQSTAFDGSKGCSVTYDNFVSTRSESSKVSQMVRHSCERQSWRIMVGNRNIVVERNLSFANAKAITSGFQTFHPGLKAKSPSFLLSIEHQIASRLPLVIQISGQSSNHIVLVV